MRRKPKHVTHHRVKFTSEPFRDEQRVIRGILSSCVIDGVKSVIRIICHTWKKRSWLIKKTHTIIIKLDYSFISDVRSNPSGLLSFNRIPFSTKVIKC